MKATRILGIIVSWQIALFAVTAVRAQSSPSVDGEKTGANSPQLPSGRLAADESKPPWSPDGVPAHGGGADSTWSATHSGGPLYLFGEDGDYAEFIDASGLPEPFAAAERARWATVNPEVVQGWGVAEGDTLILNLFPDTAYVSLVDRVTVNVNGTVTVRARLDGEPFGYLLISTTHGESLGHIRLPGRVEYGVAWVGGDHVLAQLPPGWADYVEEGPALIPPEILPEEIEELEWLARTIRGGPYDHATIDVMVVYTPAARDWMNAYGSVSNVIAQAMAKAQLTLDNSNTVASMVLVRSAEVAYTESGNSAADLIRLTASPSFNPWGNYWNGYYIPGYMDEVHEWRDTYGADLVALFARVSDTGGLAWLLNTAAGLPQYGFSLTRVQQASWTYTHIHEMGHNMGLHHHKEQNVQPGPGLFSYSAGWRWVSDNQGRYCSVMTYESGSYFPDGQNHAAVPHFSNPDVYYLGAATGHPEDGDNARTVREVKHVIAAYRDPTGSMGACCFHNGACAQLIEADCASAGGDWTMDLPCDPNPCEQPTGACCIYDAQGEPEDCLNLHEIDCTQLGGTWSANEDCFGVPPFVCPVVIWDNYPGNSIGSARRSSQDFASTNPGYHSQVADDFIFPVEVDVTGVQWVGGLYNYNPPPPGNAGAFRIIFYADDNGKPTGSGPDDPTPTALHVEEFPVENLSIQGDDPYTYFVTLTTPFTAEPNTRYWIAFQSVRGFPPQWGIFSSANDPIQGLRCQWGFPALGTSYWTPTDDPIDMAFRLYGHLLPVFGACCFADGTCEELTEEDCTGDGGEWLGMGTVCDPNPCFRLGDMNCDGVIDDSDIQPFVLALTNPDAYASTYPDCDRMLADINGDGVVDGFDIQPFVKLLIGD